MLPRIGVTPKIEENGHFSVRPEYVRAAEKAGGIPMLLPPSGGDRIAALLEAIDGLLLTGGDDVDPALYGATPHPKSRWTRERDDFEIALVRRSVDRDRPVLAICRGHQVLNVALGGTLVQDIPDEMPRALTHRIDNAPRWQTAHAIHVVPGTRLHAILGRDTLDVNSLHHQAVRGVGRGLTVSARSPDGLVEGLEMADRRFVVSVQWHPEAMWNREPDHQELFRALVAAALS